MAKSPIKVASENDDIPTTEETPDFDDDTNKGEKKSFEPDSLNGNVTYFTDRIASCFMNVSRL